MINGAQEVVLDEEWCMLDEFQLVDGEAKDFPTRKSLEGQRLSGILQQFNEGVTTVAKEYGMPTDLVQNSIQKVKKCSSITSEVNSAETRSEASEETRKEEDASSFNTDQINYRRMIEWCSKQRAAIEDTAANGQKRQAIQINKGRSWIEGNSISNGTVCTLRLGSDRNRVGIKDLPVLVWKQGYYQKSGTVRYHLCSRVGLLKGTFGREELVPQPQLTSSLMGIKLQEHEGNTALTALQAQEMYLNIGGKRSFCRCIGNCAVSKSCKCKRMNKMCTSRCHGKDRNLLCQLCSHQE